MPEHPASISKLFIRHAITSALVLLFFGIWLFEPLTSLIIKRKVPDLIMFFAVGIVSSLIGLNCIQGIELIKGGKSFSWGWYILFSTVLSLVILWMMAYMLGQVFTAT